jgi:uncharacterized phage protein (TIGR01671 family)
MREIKFRGWKKEENRFYEMSFEYGVGCSVSNEFLNHEETDILLCCRSNGIMLEQYTGLKDKNGDESYESDLCNYEYWVQTSPDPDSTGRSFSGKGKIIFSDACFMIVDIDTAHTVPLHYGDLSFEIIGNTHENPELLNN